MGSRVDVTFKVSEEIESEPVDRRSQMAYILMGSFVILTGVGLGIALGAILGAVFGVGASLFCLGLCAGLVGKLLGDE